MDLAEEEDRLRDEWPTYAQAGYRLRVPNGLFSRTRINPFDDLMGEVEFMASLTLLPPAGATAQMNEDAGRWLARWLDLTRRAIVTVAREKRALLMGSLGRPDELD